MKCSRFVRSIGGWWRFAAVLSIGAALAAGCSGSSGQESSGPSGSQGRPADNPSNGRIRIDEAKIAASADKTTLTVEIPIESIAGASRGRLNVSLREVDGNKTLDSKTVSYEVAAGGTSVVTQTFAVPGGVSEQADWVKTSLRVDDGTPKGLRVTTSLLRIVTPYALRLEGPQTIRQGKPVTYRVRAEHPFTRAPLSGTEVELLVKQDQNVVKSYTATTGPTGDAVFEVALPETGNFTVLAETSRQGTRAELESPVTVNEPGRKVLLTTDKPIYQPGQTIHLRTVALAPPENKPIANEKVLFEISDGKGNKIYKRETLTDAFGIASSRFEIGRVVNQGSFKVRAAVGSSNTEKTVEVTRYALPKFRIGLDLDRPWYGPGDSLHGSLDAGYFFGKPVAGGDVVIEALSLDVGQTLFAKVVGKTDAQGKMSFTLDLPTSLVGLPLEQGNALVTLRATVTDTAGQEVKKENAVVVARDKVHATLVPEASTLVPGVENRLHLFVTDPLGAPVVRAAVSAQLGTQSVSATTNAFGYAELRFTPAAGAASSQIPVTVTPENGAPVSQTFNFASQSGTEHVIVRTDRSVYELGETVTVEVYTSKKEARAYVDWLNDGQAVDMRTLELSDGGGSFTMPLDSALLGSNRIEAYVVDDDGNLSRAGRTIFTRTSSTLDVSLSTDKTSYAPGEPAKLTFSVSDEQGKPQVAALGVQVVDEAVFALIDARPGLLRSYFELEDAYAEPHYEIQPPPGSLRDLLFDKTRSPDPAEAEAAQTRTAAALAALSGTRVTGLSLESWSGVLSQATTLLTPYYTAEKTRLSTLVKLVILNETQALEKLGCTYRTGYCSRVGKDFPTALSDALKSSIEAYDFWGSRYSVVSNPYGFAISLTTSGPDERAATKDDSTLTFSYAELGINPLLPPGAAQGGGPGAGGKAGAGGFGGSGTGGSAGTGGAAGSGGASDDQNSGPRLREDFPETLYVNPALITGADGKATVDVNMADSITEWRVSTLAHGANGKLGGGTSGVKVFQDFFIDVDFPATLTRGDEVTFPIAVYNYLSTPQTVEVELTPAAWYSAAGATKQSVNLQPGEVRGIEFPVRVASVGLQTLTVKGIGGMKSDAVARKVLVVADGKEFSNAVSGALPAGNVKHALSIPSNAVPGSPELQLDVYPAFLSQVVKGMDSMLRVPSGCFEQTTSTAWPNVLVTEYMTETGQITPEIQLKAESLMSAGYQRLLTYEHKGGGYSWFGEQDPAPYLSVTAFGLMEFSDMARVHPVDAAMIERTRNWLLGQQEPDGSWKGDRSEFFSFHTSSVRNTAFVVWALAASGYTGAQNQSGLAFVKNNLGSEPADAYTLGIVANAFASAAPNDPKTTELLSELESNKHVDGDLITWDSAGTQTNFHCGGDDAKVATTALVAHAMLLAGGHKPSVDGALAFLVKSKDSLGNFGSTQATIWTLRTLLLATRKGTEGAVGTLEVAVDGARFTTLNLTADQSDVMTTVDLASLASAGSHEVSLSFVGSGKVSYNLVSSHHLPWSLVPPEPSGPLSVSLVYDKTTLGLNETVSATVNVKNNTPSEQSMVMVTLGLPPGFAVLTEDLDAYKSAGKLSHYELTGKQLTLYLSALAPNATATFVYRLRATMPVKASDGGAQAYLYYDPKQKCSAPATTLEATVR